MVGEEGEWELTRRMRGWPSRYAAIAKPRSPIDCNDAVVRFDDGVVVDRGTS